MEGCQIGMRKRKGVKKEGAQNRVSDPTRTTTNAEQEPSRGAGLYSTGHKVGGWRGFNPHNDKLVCCVCGKMVKYFNAWYSSRVNNYVHPLCYQKLMGKKGIGVIK
jgi:hypothetical protein